MENNTITSRRDFLKLAAAAGGGLVLGFQWDAVAGQGMALMSGDLAAPENVRFNSYLIIAPDDVITIFSPNPELGQNIKTSFPMIVAEELDADWRNVRVEQAHLDTSKYERQLTGGSGAIPHSWERLRKAGATARHLLIEAAARRWNVAAATLSAREGKVWNSVGQSLSFGSLATEAAQLALPADVPLKDKSKFTLIGTAVPNVENKNIVTGKPLFGIDFYRDGMLHAMIQRPPAFGLKVKSVEAAEAKGMPGIIDVVQFKNKVAIVGRSTWQILKARKKLRVEYEPDGILESSADHDQMLRAGLDSQEASVRRKDGDVEEAFRTAAKTIVREYQCPFLPHNPMEPMNFFAHVTAAGAELVGPSQTPDAARNEVARLLGLAPDKVTLELTRLGGGFGRRLKTDYATEAAELSAIIQAPVKVTWTREDDMAGGCYRPAVRYRFEAALDSGGNLTGYKLRGVGINSGNPTRENNFPSGAVDHLLIDSVELKSPVTTGAWRAPITNFLAFAEQSFLDEVAHEAKQDPVVFRLSLLNKAKRNPVGAIQYDIDRMKSVIELAAAKAEWGKKTGVAQGFSVYFSHRSYVAQVAEVETANNQPTLRRIIAASDCGIVVNRSGAEQQVRGGIVDGLGHAFFGNLSFKGGEPEQKNFNAFRLIRLREVPEIAVHFVDNGIDPTGLGEPALPPTGGAVANAIFKATGTRLYNQPFIKEEGLQGVTLGSRL